VDTKLLAEQIIKAFEDRNYSTIRYEAEIQTDNELDLETLYNTIYAEVADAEFSETFEVIPEVTGVSFDMDAAKKLWDAAEYGDTVIIPLIFEEPNVKAEELEALLFRDRLSALTTTLWGSTYNRINNVELAASSINELILFFERIIMFVMPLLAIANTLSYIALLISAVIG